MCIGTDDFLLATNRKYRDFLLEEKVDLTYEEGPGNHEWDFLGSLYFKNFRLASFK